MSTPVKPPGSHDFSIWYAITESTAIARRPSMSGRYSTCGEAVLVPLRSALRGVVAPVWVFRALAISMVATPSAGVPSNA
eukprot:scaffold47246_cov81-Phaeocystis_antarctica.AAC.3